jgi:hypothetical protein
MSLAQLEQAVQRAVAIRGTVMLAARDDEHRWCAVCAAVDGTLELRVGEPRGGWRHRDRRRKGEAWLRDHGFVQVIDAWANPIGRGVSARVCAETLDHALREGLAVAPGAELVEVLVHRGLLGAADPPVPGAPHGEHLRFALAGLARAGRGKLSVEGGRPAETWAWAFVDAGEMILSPESADEWTVSLDAQEVTDAADRLTALLDRDPRAPLFITCMPLHPGERPLV